MTSDDSFVQSSLESRFTAHDVAIHIAKVLCGDVQERTIQN